MTGTGLYSTRTLSVWQDTKPIISTARTPPKRPARADQTRPAPKIEAEQEADRWVTAMMFERYNG